MNTAILSPTGGSIGIGFAMSSAVVTNVVDQLREFGETPARLARRPHPGRERRHRRGPRSGRGARRAGHRCPGSPAAEGGVEVGDVILSLDGEEIADTRELVRVVGDSAEGQTVRLLVFRDGETRTVRVTLGRRETAEGMAATTPDGGAGGPPSRPRCWVWTSCP